MFLTVYKFILAREMKYQAREKTELKLE